MTVTFVNTATVFDSPALAISAATGVTFSYVAGNPYVYVAGLNDSGISAFSVSATGQLTNVTAPGGNIRDSDNPDLAITNPWGLASLSIGGSSFLYAAGYGESGISAFILGANGAMVNPGGAAGTVRDGTLPAYELANPIDVAAVTVGGNSYVIAAGVTDGGISSFSVDPLTGGFTHVADFHLDDGVFTRFNLKGVESLATAVVEGTTYVIAAGSGDNGLTIFTMNASGALSWYASLNDDATVNLAGAGAVTTAFVGGQTYIFAAGYSDAGLSVYSLPASGAPSNVFNLNDTAALHLGGVGDLATANIAGTTYLFAASFSENAVSAFAVAADGSLVDMGAVVDDLTLALFHAEQISTTVIAGQTFLAVAAAESGVSLFRIDTTGLTIDGTPGADIIDATHAPAHQLLPGELGDVISGLGGNDVIRALGGGDTLNGGSGNDLLDGGTSNDHMNGGTGNDTFVVDSAGDMLTDGGGIDLVISPFSRTLAAGFENLTLTGIAALAGAGNAAANVIAGNGGNNALSGLGGNDTLIGGAGVDRLTGGLGRDVMTGGAAHDVFDFNAVAEIGKGPTRDVIRDFQHLIDDIDVSTIDANGAAPGNGAFHLLAAKGAAFTGIRGQLHWFQVNLAGTARDATIIEGDVNGDATADFQIELTGLKTLTVVDFVL